MTLIWSFVSGACLALGVVYLLPWCRDRSKWEHLLFALIALANAGYCLVELGLMHAATPAEYLALHRWANVALFFTICGLVALVRCYFGTGRTWLAAIVVALRVVIVFMAFVPGPTFHLREVTSLVPVEFLGSSVVIPRGVVSPWLHLATFSTLLACVFIGDAAVELWRRGDATERRRAAVIGLGAILYMLFGLSNGLLIHAGVLRTPYAVSLTFAIFLVAIAFEICVGMLRSVGLAEELKDSTQSMSLAAEAAHLAHWRWEAGARGAWTSSLGRRLHGLGEEEPLDLQRVLDTLHPDDLASAREALRRAVKGDGVLQTRYRVTMPDGATRWFEASGTVEAADGRPRHVLGVSRDITEEIRMQDRFALVVDAAQNGVALTDSEGRVLLANGRAEGMLGYAPGELVGHDIRSLVPGATDGSEAPRRGDNGGPAAGTGREQLARRKDGTEFAVRVYTTSLVSVEGRLVLNTIVDITEHLRAEAEKRALQEELAHVSRVNTLSELSASLAHELNHPLAIILSNAQAAQRFLSHEPPQLAMVGEILADIVADDLRASQVLERIRSLLKRGEVALVPTDLNAAIEDLLRLLRRDLATRGVAVTRKLPPSLPAVVGDRVQLQQVVLNFILNAADAMATLDRGERSLVVSTEARGANARVSVEDRGRGLPAEPQKLFEPFFTTKADGLGIGLAVCRSIVDIHGGRIWAESLPERGAAFRFEVPLHAEPRP